MYGEAGQLFHYLDPGIEDFLDQTQLFELGAWPDFLREEKESGILPSASTWKREGVR